MNGSPDGTPHVYAKGDARLDALLELLAFAAKPMPLVRLLDDLPRRLAKLFGASVCSVYLVEGDGQELVMRGNVGFSSRAIGQVRLNVGEGITGRAVEYMRPISAELAQSHAAYKHFGDLGEERYPAFLAVPILGKNGALGAIVMQRSEPAFAKADVELACAIGSIVAGYVRQAELIDTQRESAAKRSAGGGTRKVTLTGRPVVLGRVMGAMAAMRRPAAHAPKRKGDASPKEEAKRLKQAFEDAARLVGKWQGRARELTLAEGAAFLDTYALILSDARLRDVALDEVAKGEPIAKALVAVARLATRAAMAFARDAFLEERAKDIEDLCDALVMIAAEDPRARVPQKAVLVGDNIGVFDLLVSAHAEPVAFVLSERAQSPRTKVLLELLGKPALIDVHGVFRWASDGDLALVDADHGLFIVNPSKSEIALLREERREAKRDESRANLAGASQPPRAR
jgi:phosphotransferase system enzyme I (PtsP)